MSSPASFVSPATPPRLLALRQTPLSVPAGNLWLDAQLAEAPNALGLILLAGAGWHPPLARREALVEHGLHESGFATLGVNLLTHQESVRDVDAPFNIPLLVERLIHVRRWAIHQPQLQSLRCALLASGTACAAALRLVAREPEWFYALVCRGGRPDLAGAAPLRAVDRPTLFLLPGAAEPTQQRILAHAYSLLGTREREALVIDAADAQFLAQETLDTAAQLAGQWFFRHLPYLEARPPCV